MRAGQEIHSEDTAVYFVARGKKQLRAVIHNGDDRPLPIESAKIEQLERRLYFDAADGGTFTLLYGDAKLMAPEYDYAKLFLRSEDAGAARLGPESPNPDYRDRPDDRPWTERHPILLWGAILLTMLVLGAMALRSLRPSEV